MYKNIYEVLLRTLVITYVTGRGGTNWKVADEFTVKILKENHTTGSAGNTTTLNLPMPCFTRKIVCFYHRNRRSLN
jgi:hypothetical protein